MEPACQPSCLPIAAFTRGSPGRKQKLMLGVQSIYMFMHYWFGGLFGGPEVTQPKNLKPSPSGLVFTISVILNLKVVFLFKKLKC